LKTSDFDYELPVEFIAQSPVEPRDSARLLVYDRNTGNIQHTVFRNIGSFLNSGDLLVLNETKVIKARLIGSKEDSGGKAELLLLRQKDQVTWEALVGGKGLKTGRRILIEEGIEAEIVSVLVGPKRIVRFNKPVGGLLDRIGHVPLPPYIRTRLKDPDRYQTIFAKHPGSAAAPTAGMHFTSTLLKSLKRQDVGNVSVTLHVGLDTFAPVMEETPFDHKIHSECCYLSDEAAEMVNQTKVEGGRIVAVGTTSVRTLESAALHANFGNVVSAIEGQTDLFILPGYKFRAVDALITNFHLPKSTLIMLVSAFTGRENIMRIYELAKREGYRFYSFGDAMLIL
jgi:S-adenosylmethionine:tRNA ribosyltransferase-isomerase